jgi:tetratricopeptide (TPR) repeat protein
MLWLLVLLMLVAPVLAQDVNSLFQQATQRAQAKDYPAALKLFDEALKLEPKNAAVLFNAGLAAYMAEDYPAAIGYWERFRQADPGEVRGRTKLVQALQAAGRTADAQAQVQELVKLWKTGGITDKIMVEERSFVRDQFKVGKLQVMAFQFFVPDPKRREHTYDFVVLDEKGERQAMYYFMFDEMASQQGQYYFDMRNAGGRRNIGITPRKPTYEEAAAIVRRVLKGEKLGKLINLPGTPWK